MAQEEGHSRADAVAAAEVNEAASLGAFLARDLDAFMVTYADDAVFEDQTFGDRSAGASAIREMYQTVIWWTDPDTTEVLDSFVSTDGSRAVAVLRWTGTSSVRADRSTCPPSCCTSTVTARSSRSRCTTLQTTRPRSSWGRRSSNGVSPRPLQRVGSPPSTRT